LLRNLALSNTIPNANFTLVDPFPRRWDEKDEIPQLAYRSTDPFPRWDEKDGIPVERITRFVHGSAQDKDNTTTVLVKGLREMFHETLYIFTKEGLFWTSKLLRARTKKVYVDHRLERLETVAKEAIKLLQDSLSAAEMSNATSPWPNLQRSVIHSVGFPFLALAWFGDFKTCNHKKLGQLAPTIYNLRAS
jgi:hypothetical protein